MANDPVFFSEPQVRSNDYVRQPVDHGAWLYACDDGEQILDRAPDYVPHYLFGKQPFAREFAKKYNLPLAASLMGAPSMYPELPAQAARRHQPGDAVLAGAGPAVGDEPRGRIRAARRPGSRAADPQQRLHAGRRRRQHRGPDRRAGARSSSTPARASCRTRCMAAIRTLSAKPIQFIANTSFHAEHTGGNAAAWRGGPGPQPAGLLLRPVGAARRHRLLRRSAVARHDDRPQQRDGADAGARSADGAVPADTYLEERRRKFHNGDAIELFHMPNAVTDGDSLVHFRSADVIVAGDIFTTTQYPRHRHQERRHGAGR